MMRSVRRLVEAGLSVAGYALKDRRASPRGLAGYVRHLGELGFAPKTVIDVGVGPGTPWLYEGFPSAHFELFEALDCFVPDMTRICERIDGKFTVCALGPVPGETVIEFNPDVPTGSTIAGRLSSSQLSAGGRSERRTVQVRRLDDFGPFPGPVLLKLDVEGFEGEVLKGAPETLKNVEIIISEISVMRRHRDEQSFGAFMAFMESLGFCLIDFAELTPLRNGGPLVYVDAVFARKDSPYSR